MKLNNPLEVATITTNILANYVYQAISDLDKEYLIKYDYDISYTNKRSILQGGTALIFGFDKIGENFVRKTSRTIDGIIHERIIIPKELETLFDKKSVYIDFKYFEFIENQKEILLIIKDTAIPIIEQPQTIYRPVTSTGGNYCGGTTTSSYTYTTTTFSYSTR